MYMSKKPKTLSLREAVEEIKDGEKLVLGHAAVAPHVVIEELVRQRERFQALQIYHLIYPYEPVHLAPGMEQYFRVLTSFITGKALRDAVGTERADFIPAHFSHVPRIFQRGESYEPDWLITQVTPPNAEGHYSLSLSSDYTMPAARAAKRVMVVVNDQLPFIHGDNLLREEDIDVIVEHSSAPYETPIAIPNEVEKTIAKYCAELVPDEATLQIGIGAIPDAVLELLSDRKNLGIHTELLTLGVRQLYEAGAITNIRKGVHQGKLLGSFTMGDRALYDWIDDNPEFVQYPVGYVNNPHIIGMNPKMISINSCVEVNLFGEICSEKVGGKMYSGSGGQFDYVRGVQYSEGGKSIIAFPSTAAGGKISRIVPNLTPGNVVTTHRNDADYLVTEYGVAHLKGKTDRQRAEALIAIAHPNFRAELEATLT